VADAGAAGARISDSNGAVTIVMISAIRTRTPKSRWPMRPAAQPDVERNEFSQASSRPDIPARSPERRTPNSRLLAGYLGLFHDHQVASSV
jgi:hypothetical protein